MSISVSRSPRFAASSALWKYSIGRYCIAGSVTESAHVQNLVLVIGSKFQVWCKVLGAPVCLRLPDGVALGLVENGQFKIHAVKLGIVSRGTFQQIERRL